VEKAAGFFEQALQKDSNYAPAYAALANAYGPMLQGHLLRPKEGLPKMEEAIRRALELDPTLAEAHIAMAAARFNEWDFPGAERESLRAIELSPGDALARNWYGYYLGAVGRRKDYLNEARRALELDPLNRMSNGNFATALFDAGQYAEAFEQTQQGARTRFQLHNRSSAAGRASREDGATCRGSRRVSENGRFAERSGSRSPIRKPERSESRFCSVCSILARGATAASGGDCVLL